VRVESLVQTHSDEEGRGVREEVEKMISSNNNQHDTTFDTPPRLVGEVKVTMILLPSEENSHRWIVGGDSTSSTFFTIKRSPAGKMSLKARLEGPLRVTFNL
jgi:hypothetical protein